MSRTKLLVVTLALVCALASALAVAAVQPNLPVSCDNLEPYFCGVQCVGYICSAPAPITDLCKDHFAGDYSCVYWPGHRCCSEWFAIF